MPIILSFKSLKTDQVQELPLFDKTIVGRSSSADFQIQDDKVSGKHCSFEITRKGEVLFTDLGSTNGSQLNNSSIAKTNMKIGDIIQIGDTQVKILKDRLTLMETKQIGMTTNKHQPALTIPDITNKK